ncbi:MAG: hypothetical protein QXI12_12990 [Candidatus Methanomethyliaceae archaeon]
MSFEDSFIKMWILNLDPAIPLFAPYFPNYGRPVKFEPIDLLRSLILMVDQRVLSIPEWVTILRTDRVLAILSGFPPGETPGVGTFYDFINRFWLEDDQTQKERKQKVRKPFRKPRKNPLPVTINCLPNILILLQDSALKSSSRDVMTFHSVLRY